jgi:hypothetical protein|tara:strand:- start:134 stop:346 length:213 start_codon:yes stop_codon:yes gene_type:complete
MSRIFFNFIILYFCFFVNAHAYIDPGSGSILLQALIGGIAAAGYSLTIYWGKIKNFLSKFKKKRIKSDNE